jgi:hypothetical protein
MRGLNHRTIPIAPGREARAQVPMHWEAAERAPAPAPGQEHGRIRPETRERQHGGRNSGSVGGRARPLGGIKVYLSYKNPMLGRYAYNRSGRRGMRPDQAVGGMNKDQQYAAAPTLRAFHSDHEACGPVASGRMRPVAFERPASMHRPDSNGYGSAPASGPGMGHAEASGRHGAGMPSHSLVMDGGAGAPSDTGCPVSGRIPAGARRGHASAPAESSPGAGPAGAQAPEAVLPHPGTQPTYPCDAPSRHTHEAPAASGAGSAMHGQAHETPAPALAGGRHLAGEGIQPPPYAHRSASHSRAHGHSGIRHGGPHVTGHHASGGQPPADAFSPDAPHSGSSAGRVTVIAACEEPAGWPSSAHAAGIFGPAGAGAQHAQGQAPACGEDAPEAGHNPFPRAHTASTLIAPANCTFPMAGIGPMVEPPCTTAAHAAPVPLHGPTLRRAQAGMPVFGGRRKAIQLRVISAGSPPLE